METGNLAPYQERPRTFPNMRSKPNTPLVFRILMTMNVRLLFVLMFVVFGGIFYIGASTSPIIVFVFSICIVSFILSIYLTKWVLAKDEGPPEMAQISDAIRDGAEGFFKTQYGTISKMALFLAVVIFGIYMFSHYNPSTRSFRHREVNFCVHHCLFFSFRSCMLWNGWLCWHVGFCTC